jgi:SAM-dependent methyltransferase
MTDWYEDESLWEAAYPFLFPEERFARADEQAEQVLTLAGVHGGAVLDLACGPGAHSIPFARRGFAVTGVDRSALLLSRARQRAALEGLTIEWVHHDMRTFARPGAFDLAVSLFTSFGYFTDRADDLRVLRNVHRGLTRTGVFVIDVMGKERLASMFQPTLSEEAPDGTVRFARIKVTEAWSWLENEWTFVKDGEARSFKFGHRVYSARELIDLLELAGFASVEAFAGLAGGDYGVGATRLVAVARKSVA